MTGTYHLAPDGDGELTLWWGDGLTGDDPLAVASRNTTPHHQWYLLLIGAGLDDEYELVPRAEYDEMCTDIREYYGVAL